jgi:hypothetical protein
MQSDLAAFASCHGRWRRKNKRRRRRRRMKGVFF